jgi:hypothetical protein
MYASNSVQRKGLFLAVALTIYTFGHLHYRELDKGFEENRFPDYVLSRKKGVGVGAPSVSVTKKFLAFPFSS